MVKRQLEFDNKKWSTIIFNEALYGIATSAQRWNLTLGDILKNIDFNPSRADSDSWLQESIDRHGYKYISTHVDDVEIMAK